MILIDLNNLGFAATAVARKKRQSMVPLLLGMLRDIRMTYGGKLICLHDGRSWRHAELHDYKANRDKDPEQVACKAEWVAEKALVVRMLALLGVNQLRGGNMEADDLAARVSARTKEKVWLISGDKDWAQLASDRVWWIDVVREREITNLDQFRAITGFARPALYVQAKALMGDAGDNIGGVGGIGEKGVQKLFETFDDVNHLLNEANFDEAVYKRLEKKWRDFVDDQSKQAIYRRNLRLVDLNHPDLPKIEDLKSITLPVDRDKFLRTAEEHNFTSIFLRSDVWLQPFQSEERKAA